MKITFRQTGGVAALVKSCTIDSAHLPEEESRELSSLLDQARLSERSDLDVESTPAPDREQYAITIESDDTTRHFYFSAQALSERTIPLIRYLAGRAKYEKR